MLKIMIFLQKIEFPEMKMAIFETKIQIFRKKNGNFLSQKIELFGFENGKFLAKMHIFSSKIVIFSQNIGFFTYKLGFSAQFFSIFSL